MDRIGIDTHGYSEPPDEPELSYDDINTLNAIEEEINELVKKYHSITNDSPNIDGYITNEAAGRRVQQALWMAERNK